MNFSDSEEEKFISLVSLHPALYDTSHSNYRNILIKENIWKDISKEVNKTSEDCKRKWKMIRDSFKRYRKNKAGTWPAIAKNAKGKRYLQMSFLDSIPTSRSGGTNIASPQNTTDNEDSVDLDHQERERDQDTEEEMETSQVLNESSIENLIKILKERNEKRQDLIKTIAQRKDDDVELFCNYIGNVLRSLPPLQKVEAKKHISSVLSDYEILAAKITTGTERTSYSTSSPGGSGSGSSKNEFAGLRDTHHHSKFGQNPG